MKTTTEITTKTCYTCKVEKPINEFRRHKYGHYIGKCIICEKEAQKSRYKKTKVDVSVLFPVTTKAGQTFNVSTYPINGGRKVTSPNTDKVIYTDANITRDEARAIFQSYANVPRTGISASIVE